LSWATRTHTPLPSRPASFHTAHLAPHALLPHAAQCPAVGTAIKACQAKGKKVVLSLGGAAGVYGFASDAEATTFANTLWNMFLGGTKPGFPRPFGDAVLDGVDLDIEGGGSTGYAALIAALRGFYTGAASNPSARQYLVTAAPQCPFPDAYVGDALSRSWFDLVNVQFYNNYCSVSGGANFNFATWWVPRRVVLGGAGVVRSRGACGALPTSRAPAICGTAAHFL
jgi:chitinase